MKIYWYNVCWKAIYNAQYDSLINIIIKEKITRLGVNLQPLKLVVWYFV